MTVAPSLPVSDAVIAALAATGRPVGDAEKPDGDAPYHVVYPGGTAGLSGSLLDPNEDGTHVVQVTNVGYDREGAEWARDRARAALLNRDLTITGHAVVWSELVASPPVSRDDDLGEGEARFYAIDLYHLHVTPTA